MDIAAFERRRGHALKHAQRPRQAAIAEAAQLTIQHMVGDGRGFLRIMTAGGESLLGQMPGLGD